MLTATVEEKKVEKPITKTVPLAELIKVRKELTEKFHKAEERLAELEKENSGLESALSIAKSKMEDEDVADVKKDLLKRDKELQGLEAKFAKRETSLKEKEKEVRVKGLVAEYKGRGIELDEEALMAAEDPRDVIMETVSAHLAQKEKEKEETPETPSVYETGQASTGPRKMPKDMTREELKKFETEEIAKTMAKR